MLNLLADWLDKVIWELQMLMEDTCVRPVGVESLPLQQQGPRLHCRAAGPPGPPGAGSPSDASSSSPLQSWPCQGTPTPWHCTALMTVPEV